MSSYEWLEKYNFFHIFTGHITSLKVLLKPGYKFEQLLVLGIFVFFGIFFTVTIVYLIVFISYDLQFYTIRFTSTLQRRCCISIDLRKAFDTVRWEALIKTLQSFDPSLFCENIWKLELHLLCLLLYPSHKGTSSHQSSLIY